MGIPSGRKPGLAILIGTAMFLWIIVLATRIVGGEYETEVTVSSDDEVAQFESLFEQFRRGFVDALQHAPDLAGSRE